MIAEREIVDLKNKTNSHRREIDAINDQVNQLNIITREAKSYWDKIAWYDDFKSRQEMKNETEDKNFLTIKHQVLDLFNKVSRLDTAMDQLLSEMQFFVKTQSNLSDKLDMLEQYFSRLPYGHHIAELKDQVERNQKKIADQFGEIEKTTLLPLNDIIQLVNNSIRKSDQAKEDAKIAKDFSERIEVEIKIVNRKLNEVLEKRK